MMRVETIPVSEAKPWIIHKHYAHRMPMIEHAFGLFDGSDCKGVCTFGDGSGNINNNGLGPFKMNELNRLVLDEHMAKNTASWFISRCVRCMPSPRVLVSYADANVGHVGYVYQSTNWIYTGMSEGRRVYVKDGKEYHRKTVYDMLGKHTIEDAKSAGFHYHTGAKKHRYFFLLGTKVEKRKMLELLPYRVLPYPKGNSKRYDVSASITTQSIMF